MTARPDKYQVLPELDPESFAAFKADIAERGVVVPVVVDEFGAIIDGHNRARACRELGINDYPVEVRSGLSETDKRTLARKLNVLRRHLTRDQVRQLIADQLRDTPEWADRRIGRELGVDHKTVGAVRAGLGSTGEIPQLEKTVGDDGKTRPAKQGRRRKQRDVHFDDDLDHWDDDDQPRRRRVDSWDDPTKQAKFHHAIDLIKHGVDPNSAEVAALIQQASVFVFQQTDPFAHCNQAGEREWHLFILFLSHKNWNHPEAAAYHVEYLLRKEFKDPDEFLGEEGRRFRHGWWPSERRRNQNEPSNKFKQAWAAFKQANAEKTQADIIAETEAIYRERGPLNERARKRKTRRSR
jgi:ParB-like chromosome segregation protein Spo0J